MPRNGDGSSDNGPIEDNNVIHGNSGSDKLQHTDKVAPMPEIEKGEGMNASGGGVAPNKVLDTSEGKKAEASK